MNKNINNKIREIAYILLSVMLMYPFTGQAQNETGSGTVVNVKSPDEKLEVTITLSSGNLNYAVKYAGKEMLENSPLGFTSNIGDFSKELSYVKKTERNIEKSYTQDRIKKSRIKYIANEVVCTYKNKQGQSMNVCFQVSNNDIAFNYSLPREGETARCVVEKEYTGFNFPSHTTTFLTPQSDPMIGWMHTKPSYEEVYNPDEPVGTPSQYGQGYTFPALFHIGDNGWVLLSETGVTSGYCGSHLSDASPDGLYYIAYPHPKENNGHGSASPGLPLPGSTPWRTITVGNNLKPIVETTIPFDVVDPLYSPSQNYKFGRSTWSWIMWQDNSINYEDQLTYIDLSAAMGYEFALVDGWWDTTIGYEKIEELSRYAQSKGINLYLWYNSNGYWSDAPQGPKNKMNTSVARKKEMAWMKSIGVKGIKVDFFGGDKQETMKLYEDILSDANEYGLTVIFHGCTLPRGWERLYPNYVGSEAVLASENLIFTQQACDAEAFNASLHPFIRNTVGCMEFGPVLLNKRYNRTNDGGSIRKTTDIFQLATAVLFQNPVQLFAIAPNNLADVPAFELDFMKQVPTTWDETLFIDGYPGKYCILARKHGASWYIAGINAGKDPMNVEIDVTMFNNSPVRVYYDDKNRNSHMQTMSTEKRKTIPLTIQPEGGIIITNQ